MKDPNILLSIVNCKLRDTNKSLFIICDDLDLSENEEAEYLIVGTVEADPFNGKISYESQLASAIMGAKVGDKVLVKTKEPYEVKILSVEN